MVDYLWDLMLQGEYRRSLELAEVELLKTAGDLHSLARLNYIIFFCRMKLGDLVACISSGLLALTLAQRLGNTDLEAGALVNLGWAYNRCRKYEEALAFFYDYVTLNQRTGVAPFREELAWRGIGLSLSNQMRSAEAIKAHERVVAIVSRHGKREDELRAVLDLVSIRLGGAATDPEQFLPGTKELLQTVRSELKQDPALIALETLYLVQVAYYYLYGKRYGRAIVVAHRGLQLSKGDKYLEYRFHMILYRAYSAVQNHKDAFGHALAARMAAIADRRYDLEFEAAEQMATVLRRQGLGVMTELDREYQGMGIDLGQFISPNSIQRKAQAN